MVPQEKILKDIHLTCLLLLTFRFIWMKTNCNSHYGVKHTYIKHKTKLKTSTRQKQEDNNKIKKYVGNQLIVASLLTLTD